MHVVLEKSSCNLFLRLTKIGLLLFCFYIFWFREVVGYNNAFLYGSSFFSIATMFLDIIARRGKIRTKSFLQGWVFWLLFGIFCFISSLVCSVDLDVSLDSLIQYFAFLIMGYVICYITITEQSFDWFINIFICISSICCLHLLFKPYQIYFSRYSLGPNNNPNTLATTAFFGLFCVLLKLKKKGKETFLYYIMLTLFLYTIIKANSRKMLFVSLFLLIIWLIAYLKDLSKSKHVVLKLCVYTGLIIVGLLVLWYLATEFKESDLAIRLRGFFTEESNGVRLSMYEEAFMFFLENPICGIGYDCFKIKSASGVYSHTTYGEAIACSGIIGTLLFFFPIISTTKKSIYALLNNRSYQDWIFFALLISEWFLALGQILFYDVVHMFFFMIIFYFFGEDSKGIRVHVD